MRKFTLNPEVSLHWVTGRLPLTYMGANLHAL
jgi:hypothetical protein